MSAEGLSRLTSAVIYDVMTFDLAYDRQFALKNEIRLATGTKVVGPAFTVAGQFTPNRLSKYEERARVIDMLEHMSAGVIEVLQPNYAGPLGSWGDFTATLVRKFGCTGAVVDGFTRDIKGLNEMQFSLFCKGTSLVNGFGSGWQISDFQCPVAMPGPLEVPVTVNPGDYVVGDDDGVVIVPREMIDDVVEHAIRRLDREEDLKAQLAQDGLTPADLKKTIFEW